MLSNVCIRVLKRYVVRRLERITIINDDLFMPEIGHRRADRDVQNPDRETVRIIIIVI